MARQRFVSPEFMATKLGRSPSQTARLRMDGLRLFPGLSNWLNDPFGMAAILLGPADSTGSSPNTTEGSAIGGSSNYVRAPDQVAMMIAAAYPNIRVELDVLDWGNYTTQTPGDPAVAPYQTTRVLGTSITPPYAAMPASSNQVLSHARTARTSLTSNRYFFAAKVDPDPGQGWVPSAVKNIIAMSGPSGSFGCWLYLDTTGKLIFRHSVDGTALSTRTSTVAVPGVVGTPLWVAVDANINNGSGGQLFTFYTSTDGRNWTQLGAQVTINNGSTTWYQAPSSYWTLGSQSAGNATNNWLGKIYECQIRKGGMYGPTILPVWPGNWHWGGQGSTVAFYPIQGNPLLRIVNASWPGKGLDDFDSGTLLPVAVPHLPYLATVVNTGHNDKPYFGSELASKWDRLLDRLESRVGEACSIGLMTQNATIRVDGPTQNPLASRNDHKTRMAQLASYAQYRGLSVIDTYSVFTDYVAACASGARSPVAVQPTDNVTAGNGTLLDLIHYAADGQAGVHPKDPVVGGNRLQGGAYLQARKIYEELTS